MNRIGDTWFDQIERTGHADRISDLDLLAEMGLRTLRYPILWERTAPAGIASADWTWADQRMQRFADLGVRPIVGLLHHGSGPEGTDLLDRCFPQKLAEYAGAVAERYPWVTDYTPVNEPLTTARFSGLYGHWYPHAHSDREFLQAILNECRATGDAMRAIRKVNSAARLIQTEDIAQVFSTPRLQYQADFENERRWLSYDLLCGRVTRDHPLADYLRWAGANQDDLAYIADNPSPPDVLGLNYYLTSERFLDERLDRYPQHTHGGNGRDRYADIEAVRVRAEGIAGLYPLIQSAFERYGLPMVITETHIGCTDDEQIRWVNEVWTSALRASADGLPVEAVTVWSLLGAYDWDSLVTKSRGHYEAGAFDVSSGVPTPSRLAEFVRALAEGETGDAAILDSPGWWRRAERHLYPVVACPSPVQFASSRARPNWQRIGTLAQAGADSDLVLSR